MGGFLPSQIILSNDPCGVGLNILLVFRLVDNEWGKNLSNLLVNLLFDKR